MLTLINSSAGWVLAKHVQYSDTFNFFVALPWFPPLCKAYNRPIPKYDRLKSFEKIRRLEIEVRSTAEKDIEIEYRYTNPSICNLFVATPKCEQGRKAKKTGLKIRPSNRIN